MGQEKKQQVSDGFQLSIKEYLDKRAASDPLFAKTYAKPNKSLEECCNYIVAEVIKSGRKGFADSEIFNMAVHYYDEDNIGDIELVDVRVVVNHTVELSEEEKEEAHREALRQEVEAERKRLEEQKKARQEKLQKKQPTESASQQLSLFE